MTQPVRQWYVAQALNSFSSMVSVLGELTEAEVIAALETESRAQRRKAILDRLVSRAVRLNEIAYSKKLKEKYHGTQPLQRPDERQP